VIAVFARRVEMYAIVEEMLSAEAVA